MHSRRLPQGKLFMRSLFFGNWVRIHSCLLNCSHAFTSRCSLTTNIKISNPGRKQRIAFLSLLSFNGEYRLGLIDVHRCRVSSLDSIINVWPTPRFRYVYYYSWFFVWINVPQCRYSFGFRKISEKAIRMPLVDSQKSPQTPLNNLEPAIPSDPLRRVHSTIFMIYLLSVKRRDRRIWRLVTYLCLIWTFPRTFKRRQRWARSPFLPDHHHVFHC